MSDELCSCFDESEICRLKKNIHIESTNMTDANDSLDYSDSFYFSDLTDSSELI